MGEATTGDLWMLRELFTVYPSTDFIEVTLGHETVGSVSENPSIAARNPHAAHYLHSLIEATMTR